jgi:hypothetical protein
LSLEPGFWWRSFGKVEHLERALDPVPVAVGDLTNEPPVALAQDQPARLGPTDGELFEQSVSHALPDHGGLFQTRHSVSIGDRRDSVPVVHQRCNGRLSRFVLLRLVRIVRKIRLPSRSSTTRSL